MPREMPILKHKGDKLLAGKSFWSIPQDITVYAFNNLTYSECQVLIYLMGNKPKSEDEDFVGWQLSNINDCVGCNERTVRAARTTLEQMGFISQIADAAGGYLWIVVNFDWIREVIKNNWDKPTVIAKWKNRSGSPQPLPASK